MSESQTASGVDGGSTGTAHRPSMPLAVLRLLRPTQWTKNGLLFLAFAFSLNLHWDLDDSAAALRLLLQAATGAAIYVGLSGATYIINDIIDADRDRAHPTKRTRPIAAGYVTPVVGGLVSAMMLAVCLGGAFAMSWLMGLIADTVMSRGGRVTGIIPTDLFDDEVGHESLTALEKVDSMHTRKALMYELSDAFIALPGGFGTLDELAETLTWNQLGIMAKPVGVLNVNGFWTPLLEQFDRMVDRTILKPSNRQTLLAEDCPAALLDALANHSNSSDPKWIRA